MSAPPRSPSDRRPPPRLLSIVAPAFNEAEGLPQFVKEVGAVAPPLAEDFEILIVDDGSRDTSVEVLTELARADAHVRWVGLSRNFGHQAALLAGLEHACGDAVVTMDSDLQHPPELLPQMVDLWRDGHDVVYTSKARARVMSLRRRLSMKLGYSILRFISGLDLKFGQSDFRLLDRAVLEVLVAMPERDKFLRGLISWVGFRQVGIEYEPRERFAGEEKYTFRQLLHLVTTGVFSFTILPLRLFTAFGVTIAVLSLIYGFTAVVSGALALITGDTAYSPPGWATLAAAITLLGGIQLIGIGLLGEYVGRVYDQTKGRPTYVVGRTSPAPRDPAERRAEPRDDPAPATSAAER